MQRNDRPPRPAEADASASITFRPRVTLQLDGELNILRWRDPGHFLGDMDGLEGRHLSALLPELSCLTRQECVANLSSFELRPAGVLPPEVERLATELRQSEQRFRLLFDTNPLPLWIYDLESFVFLAVNDAAAAMYGYSCEELLTMEVRALWPEADAAELEREVTRPRTSGFFEVGVRTRLKQGGSRVQAMIYTHDLIFKGHSARIVIANDVTEQQRIQRMMTRGTRALEMLVGNAPLAAVLEELCLAVQDESEGNCHCSVLLLDGNRFTVAAAPSLPEVFAQAIEGCGLAPDVSVFGHAVWQEREVVSQDITFDPLWRDLGMLALGLGLRASWSMPIPSGKGGVIGVLFTCYDLPRLPAQSELAFGRRLAQIAGIAIDHHAADEEVRRLNAELEQRIRERTVQLESANRELESFSYTVAHDLRAPLRAIAGYSALLVSDHAAGLNAEGLSYANRITSVGKRMSEMIEALLDLSRLSRVALKRSEVNLSKLATGIADELRSGDSTRHVEFHIVPDMVVEADQNLLTVVMQNLIGNAWKYTRHAEQARIEFGCKEEEAGRIYFVRDNGAGFDMRFAAKLFGAFERLHRADEYEGSGIGLATVRRVIHRHGGRVWAEGRSGEGATFYFTLIMDQAQV